MPSVSEAFLIALENGMSIYDTIKGAEMHTGRSFPNSTYIWNPRTARSLIKRGLIEVRVIQEHGVQRRKYFSSTGGAK